MSFSIVYVMCFNYFLENSILKNCALNIHSTFSFLYQKILSSKILNMNNSTLISEEHLCISENQGEYLTKIIYLKKISYGIIMPIMCMFGIFGNLMNLLVLTRRNIQGIAYFYMQGKLSL